MKVGWVYHEDFLRHDTGRTHVEQPERLEVIIESLKAEGLLGKMEALSFEAADAGVIASIHEPAYIDLVRVFCDEGVMFIGSMETRIGPWSYDVARLAVGGVIAACDAVMAGRVGRAFCAVRPPGHHAERDQAMGFCLFNNVAIGAEHLIRKHGLKRVAVVDFDVHHGNGTQHAFETRDDVLYISIHEHPNSLFPGTGLETERGVGKGEGFTLNVPLYAGSDDAVYRRAFTDKVLPRLEEYRPEFLLVSAGFDAVRQERIAHMCLDPESYGWMTADLVRVADQYCQGRLVSVLEGGYVLDVLGRSVAIHVAGLMEGK
ncbi:MAG: histone deacetylase family protein [Bacillota bacterium]